MTVHPHGIQLLVNVLHALNIKVTTCETVLYIENKTMVEIERLLERSIQDVPPPSVLEALQSAKAILVRRLAMRRNVLMAAEKPTAVKCETETLTERLLRENQLLRALLGKHGIALPTDIDGATPSSAVCAVGNVLEDASSVVCTEVSAPPSVFNHISSDVVEATPPLVQKPASTPKPKKPRMSKQDMVVFRDIISFIETHRDWFYKPKPGSSPSRGGFGD